MYLAIENLQFGPILLRDHAIAKTTSKLGFSVAASLSAWMVHPGSLSRGLYDCIRSPCDSQSTTDADFPSVSNVEVGGNYKHTIR